MNAPLRIAIFVGAFPVTSETFILRQITGLLELGHDVRIFANARSEDAVVHQAVSKYRLLDRTTFVDGPPESVVWEMPIRPVSGETWLPGAEHPITNVSRLLHAFPVLKRCAATAPKLTRDVLDARQHGFRARSLSGAYRLATLLESGERFDVLHAHFGPVADAFRFARELFDAPLVVSFHGYDFCTVPRKQGADVYQQLWPSADSVIANSRYSAERLRALHCLDEKISILPVGLHPEEYALENREIGLGETVRILTVARLVEIKGHADAIRAVAQLRKMGADVQYEIVGDGPLRASLAGLIDDLGLIGVVRLHGSKTEAEVRQCFANADVFLLPSRSINGDAEGQGLVLQEAQASGLPVVATRHGAFAEGLAPENQRWMCDEGDPSAIARALSSLIDARAEWPQIGRAGQEFVRSRYDAQLLNEQLVGIYRDVIARYRAKR
jgi:colanic acid/amylovoran biosynthesis glycosyltransferase